MTARMGETPIHQGSEARETGAEKVCGARQFPLTEKQWKLTLERGRDARGIPSFTAVLGAGMVPGPFAVFLRRCF